MIYSLFLEVPGAGSGSSIAFNVFLLVVLSGALYFMIRKHQKEKAEHDELIRKNQEFANDLERAYRTALRGTDRIKALELGRQYYSNKRGGALTIYDEQALTNDLSTMR